MFGLSWGQISIIVLVAVFVLGPERIPTAVTFLIGTLRSARTMVDGTKAGLLREIGPELEELRRQVADLQSLKDIQELRDQRDLSPQRSLNNQPIGQGGSRHERFSRGPTRSSAHPASADNRNAASRRSLTVTSTCPTSVVMVEPQPECPAGGFA